YYARVCWPPRPPAATAQTWRTRRSWRPRDRGRRVASVADLLLQVLPALLLVDGALGGEARLQPVEADFLARIDAVAVLALVHALERAVDLADQLAVAVAGAQFQRVLGLARGALGLVADVAHFVLEVLDGLLGFLVHVRAPLQPRLAEVLQPQRVHALLAGARLVAVGHAPATAVVGLVRDHLGLGARRGRGRRCDPRDRDLADRACARCGARRRLDTGLLGRTRRGLGDRALRGLGRGGLLRDRRLPDRRRLRGRGLLRDGLLDRGFLRDGLLRRSLLHRRLLRHGLLRRRGLLRHGLPGGGLLGRRLPGRRLLRDRLLRRHLLHRRLLRRALPGNGLLRRLLHGSLGGGLPGGSLGRLLRGFLRSHGVSFLFFP